MAAPATPRGILGIQTLAYFGKIAIHPVPIASLDDLWARAAVEPIPGELVVLDGAARRASVSPSSLSDLPKAFAKGGSV